MKKYLLFIGFSVAALSSGDALAAAGGGPMLGSSGLGQTIQNTVESSDMLPALFAGLSYMFGIVLGAFAIAKLYEHVQNPNQVPVWEGLKRFIAGGAFLALPMVMEAVRNTMTGGGAGSTHELSGFGGATSGSGLDAMVTALMADIWLPMHLLIRGFCYLVGIVLVMVGISRLLKSTQEGPRGPGGIGTIMVFITAGAFFSMNSMMAAWTTSMFGTDTTSTIPDLQYTGGMTNPEVLHVEAVISALIAFVAILGWISFIRGWFIVKEVSNGSQNASMMAGITHLFGGALAINLGPVINAVQTTLGLTGYGVNFTG